MQKLIYYWAPGMKYRHDAPEIAQPCHLMLPPCSHWQMPVVIKGLPRGSYWTSNLYWLDAVPVQHIMVWHQGVEQWINLETIPTCERMKKHFTPGEIVSELANEIGLQGGVDLPEGWYCLPDPGPE